MALDIILLIDQPAIRIPLQERGRETALNYDYQKIMNQLEGIFYQIMNCRNPVNE